MPRLTNSTNFKFLCVFKHWLYAKKHICLFDLWPQVTSRKTSHCWSFCTLVEMHLLHKPEGLTICHSQVISIWSDFLSFYLIDVWCLTCRPPPPKSSLAQIHMEVYYPWEFQVSSISGSKALGCTKICWDSLIWPRTLSDFTNRSLLCIFLFLTLICIYCENLKVSVSVSVYSSFLVSKSRI